MTTKPEVRITDITVVTPDLPDGEEEGYVLLVKLPDNASRTFIWDGERWVLLAQPDS